jgi:hypothetical protein
MPILVSIIGGVITVAGIVFQIKPQIAKSMLEFFIEGKRLYIHAIARIIVAIIFLLAAQKCRIPWVIILLGVLMLASGIVIFGVNLEKIKSFLRWILGKFPLSIRILSSIAIILGIILIYSGR